ncbi:hypothetical protein B0I68_001163 [Clostridium beijerinckii]|uniref:hypothetical protein n=1 Tax=Clostridium beijerinckii TaxID=1520 RepID=UPI0015701A9A|nr:hypothetical protein [Clostridium beijerinckii]NRT27558.1 hypothetical protein [Clostridium beijerinckii]NRY66169.1 hypothetical protein [Clostridium beijerinckii]NSA88580.1 hypothetical protein [Clostridium beijerinckii]
MKSKLIDLKNHNRINNVVIRDNYEFKVVPVVCNNYDNKTKELISKKKKVVIEIMDLELNIAKVHPISDFVTLWKEKSYNTQKNRAYTVVRFFNYLLENNNRFKLNTFCDIDIFHGNEYLSYVVLNRCSESYFLAERKTLDKLYLYLFDKKLLNNIDSSIFENMKVTEYKYTNRAVVNPIVGTIFKDCIYPSNKKNAKRLHVLKEEFIIPFIETSIEIEPRIALGIFMQCFGGLRRSEVVNIKKNSISMFDWGTVKLEVNVNDEIISDVIKDYNQASNKRQRKQVIYNVGDYLPKLLKMHLIDKNYCASDGSDALFSNKKNQLLTASMYSYYFNKVKSVFIKN